MQYAYANAQTWTCKCTWLDLTWLISFFNLQLDLVLLFFCTWSLGSKWPLSPLGNSLLLKSELVPIHKWRVYFSRPSHLFISLKSVQGLAQVLDNTALAHYEVKARYPLTVLIPFFLLDIIMHAPCICLIFYIQIFMLAWCSCT